MIRTLLASAVAIGFAGTAFAGTAFTAKLQTPMDKAQEIVAAKVLWSCNGDTCRAELSRKTANVGTCKKVVKEIGKVTEFASTKGELSDTELEACNAFAK